MLLGVIADDFTGASDIANTLAQGVSGTGLAVCQYLGIPQTAATPDIDAGVVALKSRSIAADAAVRQSLSALSWLQAQGCRQFVFKYCSTFDSTPDGNIGPVAEALADALGVKGVAACPAFPTVGRTVHQGHLFVQDRLLNESGMQDHPLTPMTDPDLRRWLARQTRTPVGLVPASVVRSGAASIRQALDAAAVRGETLAIVDAAIDADLQAIGLACKDASLLTGGSGIALGLPANFLAAHEAKGIVEPFSGIDGGDAILAGSCSAATRQQIEVHARTHPVLPIAVDDVMHGTIGPGDVIDFAMRHRGAVPLAFSSGSPERGDERASAVRARGGGGKTRRVVR